jgi:hypothetical protein
VSVPPIIFKPGNLLKCALCRTLRYIYGKLLKRIKKMKCIVWLQSTKAGKDIKKPVLGNNSTCIWTPEVYFAES